MGQEAFLLPGQPPGPRGLQHLVNRNLLSLGCMLYSLLVLASGQIVAWACSMTLTIIGVIYIMMECCLNKEYKETYLRERLI